MELNLNNNKVYSAIHRFYSNFKLRRKSKSNSNPNQYILNNINKIIIVKIYYKKCVYSNNINIIKDNIVIKFKLNKFNKEVISLNLLLENYNDLFEEIK
jgi:hypothetical protein